RSPMTPNTTSASAVSPKVAKPCVDEARHVAQVGLDALRQAGHIERTVGGGRQHADRPEQHTQEGELRLAFTEQRVQRDQDGQREQPAPGERHRTDPFRPSVALPQDDAGPAENQPRKEAMNPVTFLEGVYRAGGAGKFDALGYHPYTYPAMPT